MEGQVIRYPVLILLAALSARSQVVALDGFHNDETKLPDHYRWDGTRPGGFSELGKLIEEAGGTTRTIRERITAEALRGVDVFIIVDPDTPLESDHPKYIETAEADAIEKWVRAGGRIMLMGNDKGNAEFEHFNRLAGRFGIHFREETYPKVAGKAILRAKGAGPVFGSGSTVYLVEVAPLEVQDPQGVLLADNGTPIMALVHAGKGEVFAVGDPWVYNEYIGREDNRKVAGALMRHLLKRE
jgi:unsaturated rhamnogalacturonyl hydrolase